MDARLSSPRWPGGARIDKLKPPLGSNCTPKQTYTAVTAKADWLSNNAAAVFSRSQTAEDQRRGPEKWDSGSRADLLHNTHIDLPPLMLETMEKTIPGPKSSRRAEERWEGGNREDRNRGSITYEDFTETIITAPGINSERRTSPRWQGGNRLDRKRGIESSSLSLCGTVADCLSPSASKS